MNAANYVGLGIIATVVGAAVYFGHMWYMARKAIANPDAVAREGLDLSDPEDMQEYREMRELITQVREVIEHYFVPIKPMLFGLLAVVVTVLLWIALSLLRVR